MGSSPPDSLGVMSTAVGGRGKRGEDSAITSRTRSRLVPWYRSLAFIPTLQIDSRGHGSIQRGSIYIFRKKNINY